MRAASCLALIVLGLVPAVHAQPCGGGDTLTVVPAEPTADDSITLHMRGISGASIAFLFDTTHELQGSTIRLDTTLYPGSFAVPSNYGDDREVGQLAPGTYTVEEWIQCWYEAPVGSPYLAASTSFTVGGAGGAVPAIPTLSEVGIGLLVLSLLLAAIFLLRYRG